MKKIPKIIILFFLFSKSLSNDTTIDIRKYKLNQYMKQFFSFNPEINPFLKALNEFEDHKASIPDIETIFGANYSTVKDQFEQTRKYAAGLVISEMKMYEKNMPYENPKLKMIFRDFYDFMNFDLDPYTLSLNKDTYTIFKELNEPAFTDIFSNLAELYKKYIPLKKHIEFIKIIYLKKIHDLVRIKCPIFRNEEIEAISDDKEEIVKGINQKHAEENLGRDRTNMDPIQEFKVKSLFKMMNKHREEERVWIFPVFALLGILF